MIKRLTFAFFVLILATTACSKEENGDSEEPLVYASLTAIKTTLKPGETTRINAVATGSNLKYIWTATQGDILGSGAEVTYAPSICHVGMNQVSCEITGGKNQSEKKTIQIQVIDE